MGFTRSDRTISSTEVSGGRRSSSIILKALTSVALTSIVVTGIAGTAMAEDTSGVAPASPIPQARVAHQAVPTHAFAEVLTPELRERLEELEQAGQCQRLNPQGAADPLAGQTATAEPFMLVAVTGDTPTVLKCNMGGKSGGGTGGNPGRRNGPGQQNDPWKTYETFCGSRDGARPGLPHQGWTSNLTVAELRQNARTMRSLARAFQAASEDAGKIVKDDADRFRRATERHDNVDLVLAGLLVVSDVIFTDRASDITSVLSLAFDALASKYEQEADALADEERDRYGSTSGGDSSPTPDDMGSADRAAFCQGLADGILAREHLEQTAKYGPNYINSNCGDPVTNPAPVNDTASAAPTLNPTGNRWQLDCTPKTDAPVSPDGSIPGGVGGEVVPESHFGDGNGVGSKVPRKVPGLTYGFEPYCDPSVCTKSF